MARDYLPHIFLTDSGKTHPYTRPKTRGSKPLIPKRDRGQHSQKIREALDKAWREARQKTEERTAVSIPTKDGIYLEFQSQAGKDLVTKSLESLTSGIRLLNIKIDNTSEVPVTTATVYVPGNKEGYFLKKVGKYAEEETPKGKPKNAPLINSIEDIRLAILESSFWQDSASLLPGGKAEWCEVWLSSEVDEVKNSFCHLADVLNIEYGEGALKFPELTIILIKATSAQLANLIEASPDIAEFRRAKETARFFMELENKDQIKWAQELRARLSVKKDSKIAVCILDTGANNGHLLLQPILKDGDLHSFNPEWGCEDHDGHGTLMCGIAAYGDLQKALERQGEEIELLHNLESVKILPPRGQNKPHLYGYITSQSLSRVGIQEPNRIHIVCMAITATDNRDKGRPSSWSAAIDAITSGCYDDEKRLFIICAGNVDPTELKNYPDSNLTDGIHDPAQSWNALTVGAFTEKTFFSDPDLIDYTPVAPSGGLSPYSCTSLIWETSKWPTKPDIVLEGGNAVRSSDDFVSSCDDLSILSTCYEPIKKQFGVIDATSAASANAAWMAARIQAAYPDAWPETIRGLLVHSAEWTEKMKEQFLRNESKSEYGRLLRVCGYGVPNMQRAMECATNSLTLIAQEVIQPYDKKYRESSPGYSYCTKDMHLHELPWPKDVLLSLGETPITMRITLSYFIEPGPGEIGWKDRYRYASHAFRFDLNSPNETDDDFKKRLNAAARAEGESLDNDSGSDRWTIGSNGRKLGSIHSDIWVGGTAAEIASCNKIGIYPVIGWWRERANLGRWNKQTRYSLIVSLHTPEKSVDIYTPVAIKLRVPITT